MKHHVKRIICMGLVFLIGLCLAEAATAEEDVSIRIFHSTGEECTPEEEAAQNQPTKENQNSEPTPTASSQPFQDDKPQVPVVSSQDVAAITPASGSPYPCTHENCYWSTPMDITDEARVWAMLMAPITVLNVGQKKQVELRKEPSDESEAIADVTGYSQGVHVLKTLENGWSLVEVYSSSFHDSTIKAWNQFTQGYVKTSLLQVKEVGNHELAMVMDKLTQRVYLFKDGKLFSELLASTGLPNDKQPYNETRSGEFLLVSAVGQFKSDNLLCNYGIRFNFGDLIHEVPHVLNGDGTPNYTTCEKQLGERASHGCIRIQRLTNGEGINMRWIWNEIYKSVAKQNVKFVIWEDLPGRQISVPSADTVLYYNAKGGTNYHVAPECNGVRAKYLPMASFTYGELDDDQYMDLIACGYCAPPMRVAEIEARNLKTATATILQPAR